MKRGAPGVLAVTLLASCHATEPTPMSAFSGEYVLAIDASPTCIGDRALRARSFRWVVMTVAAGSEASFVLPPVDDPKGLDDLHLELGIDGDRVQGSLYGSVRVDRSTTAGSGLLAVLYGEQPMRFEQTTATLSGRVRFAEGRAWITSGVLDGTINMRDYDLSNRAYGICRAADHSWSLLLR